MIMGDYEQKETYLEIYKRDKTKSKWWKYMLKYKQKLFNFLQDTNPKE